MEMVLCREREREMEMVLCREREREMEMVLCREREREREREKERGTKAQSSCFMVSMALN